MATVRVLKNIFDINETETFSVNAGICIEQIIREHSTGDEYKGLIAECYDSDTGETFFLPLDENSDFTDAVVVVNDKSVSLDYKVGENDVVMIVITPSGGHNPVKAVSKGIDRAGRAMTQNLHSISKLGAGLGAALGIGIAFVLGAGIGGLIVFGLIGAAAGFYSVEWIADQQDKKLKQKKAGSKSGLSSDSLPDVRGASNQPLADSPLPFVLGKHLTTPFIVGTPWNEISGTYGTTNYIHALYCVGYAPLKITDIKLGDMYLAHNKKWSGNQSMKNIFCGALTGLDKGAGTGDIVNTWWANDFTVEILQQKQDGSEMNYGTVYPVAKIQTDVNANALYLVDGDLAMGELISYKGLGLMNGLRNNPVYFTEHYPKTIKVELDFTQGLYKTRTEQYGDWSGVYYYQIPCWVAIQWRVYSDENDASDGTAHGVFEDRNYDYGNKTYVSKKRSWHSFSTINGWLGVSVYDAQQRNWDIAAHSNEQHLNAGAINGGWLGAQAFNFGVMGGTNSNKNGINEFRVTTSVDLEQWARDNLRSQNDTEEQFIEKFRSYFYDGSNTARSVEVRVVRLSPCYMDETISYSAWGPYSYSDLFTWRTLTSTMLDMDVLNTKNKIVEKRPLDDEYMRKLCLISIKAKTDNTDQIGGSLKKFSCTAESFAPYYDTETKRWVPENVRAVSKYYAPDGTEITKGQFESDRQNGVKSIMLPGGNDFIRNLVNNVIFTQNHLDSKGRCFIPDTDDEQHTIKYLTNNVASMFLLAGIGPHLGIDALGYTQSNFADNGPGDFNMRGLAEWHEWAKDVTDGSTYPADNFHYDHDGNIVHHSKGDEVHIYFAANAYIYQSETLEGILNKIAVAGRAIFTRDKQNRLVPIIDKEELYPVAMINQQNTLKSSYTISFAQNPSGLQVSYPDENDGYRTNILYCMADGEDSKKPRYSIEPCKFDYVTNNYQQWSLGRYLLATRLLSKEVVTKQLGVEGASINLGDVVVLQDDTMLIGTDTGGRITRVLEDENKVYGFLINNTYHYTGETEEVTDSEGNVVLGPNGEPSIRCKQGVIVLQPAQYKESRVITLRLAKEGSFVTLGEETFTMRKGQTNIVLLDEIISKDEEPQDGSVYYMFRPKAENIVGFGIIGKMSALYRVVKKKGDAKHTYEFTLTKYQDELYRYGAELPSFQNNMTIPDRSGENSFALSNNATQADLKKAVAEALRQTEGIIKNVFGNEPGVPSDLRADVKEDCIQFTCKVYTDDISTIDYITYEITKADGTVVTLDGSYSTEYYFDRDEDGYPEKDTLEDWLFRARAVSSFTDDGERVVSEWSDYVSLSEESLAAYGTWIPPKPVVSSFVAEENGITAVWACDLTNVYGNVQYEVSYYYEETLRKTETVLLKAATYQFDRNVDGYPEKPNTAGIGVSTLTLDNYSVIVRAVNITSNMFNTSDRTYCDYSRYKTWIPGKPVVTSRISNRTVTLYLSQNTDCYGAVQYLVGVRRYDDPAEFYYPDLESNPYGNEDAYKLIRNGAFVVGKIESGSPYSQTLPLETQSGILMYLDCDESDEDDRCLAVPTLSLAGYKMLTVSTGELNPIDTTYQYEVYAFNKTTQGVEDKISVEGEIKSVTALATSVQDIMNGAITSEKLGDGAITETKIEDDAITTPKIHANAVVSDKIYSYNNISLADGTHVISGFAPSPDTDEEFFQYTQTIKNNRSDTASIDRYIKSRSKSYWMGLDTDHPEFYMGNVTVGDKNLEEANYFHYYYDTASKETNLDIKLSNFIVTAVTSTIRGLFNVKDKKSGNFDYANSFLQVNPESTQNLTYGTEAETVLLKGDFMLVAGNNSDITGKTGNLTVQGSGTFGSLSVNGLSSLNGNVTIGGDLIVSTGSTNLNGLSVAEDLSVGGDAEVTGGLDVTGDVGLGANLSVNKDVVTGGFVKAAHIRLLRGRPTTIEEGDIWME